MAGKGECNSWLGLLQLTPTLVTCHTPSMVGVWFSPGSLHTSKVLAATARVITAIFVLSFIFCSFCRFVFSFGTDRKLWPPEPRAVPSLPAGRFGRESSGTF